MTRVETNMEASFLVFVLGISILSVQSASMSYTITTLWDSTPVSSADHVKLTFSSSPTGLHISVDAPFYHDPPPPGGQPGSSYNHLYNFEVVEAFFLNDHNQYLEIELAPHGEHLVLMLNGRRHAIKIGLPIQFTAHRHKHRWTGTAHIPADLFPPQVTKFNAYAIHGTSSARTYLSLYPVPYGKFTNPDFHKLEYFHHIDFSRLISSNANSEPSALWKPYIVG
ncbi:UPF0462 protein C4orf33 homolog [Gigantopelta aegis]|uniref:UPF0462 protein C4orf33 homolog n=1 Tax=Gigantopelta aegis TaxID=1735272 RepID=UPI001B888E00|nr:UPF0462 protein C4orf33 homolog [Gigantopelta aegis]